MKKIKVKTAEHNVPDSRYQVQVPREKGKKRKTDQLAKENGGQKLYVMDGKGTIVFGFSSITDVGKFLVAIGSLAALGYFVVMPWQK